ncbi:MAG: SDR family oxidoreductase [bacterium]|nr:SDR family oxidoreductase [bacterium]
MLKEKFDLTGRCALVTGSARGIGRAIAAGLAEFGARVVVHGSKPSQPLDESLAAVQAFAPESFAVTGDLSSPGSIADIFAQMRERGVEPDIVICNASVQKNVPWNEIPLEEMQWQMQVNFNATFQMFQMAYPHMKAQGWGRMIVVGSVQEQRPHPMMAVYAASKSAQENLVRNLARQISKEGITVNNLCPGVFATDRNKEALGNPVYAEKVMNAIPMHDYARPEDAAGTAVLLASDAGRYITGTTIMIDGGLRLPG